MRFFKELKADGFRVGIRMQPFIPGITTLDIVKMFEGADNFSLEGLKVVSNSEEAHNLVFRELGMSLDDFEPRGTLNIKPEIRLRLYAPFIEYFEAHNIPFSIADNDLHYIGTNRCCCGDALVGKSSGIDSTALIKKYGEDYTLENVNTELTRLGCADCTCKDLYFSYDTEDAKTVREFYAIRFRRPTSIFSPKLLYFTPESKGQMSLF